MQFFSMILEAFNWKCTKRKEVNMCFKDVWLVDQNVSTILCKEFCPLLHFSRCVKFDFYTDVGSEKAPVWLTDFAFVFFCLSLIQNDKDKCQLSRAINYSHRPLSWNASFKKDERKCRNQWYFKTGANDTNDLISSYHRIQYDDIPLEYSEFILNQIRFQYCHITVKWKVWIDSLIKIFQSREV